MPFRVPCVFVVLFAVVCWCLGLIWSVRARSPLAHPASFDGLGQPSSAIPRACSVGAVVGWLVGGLSLGRCWSVVVLALCVVCVVGSETEIFYRNSGVLLLRKRLEAVNPLHEHLIHRFVENPDFFRSSRRFRLALKRH